MVDCMECTNFIKCHYSGQLTGRLTSCPDFKQKPKTNAERIRAMIDAEQAFLKVREENKTLRRQLEIMTKDRDYYRDAYHHLLREGKE